MVLLFANLLNDVYAAIQSSKGIKFSSSSLLLVYDAVSHPDSGPPVLNLIDFENAVDAGSEEADKDVLEGISNLRAFFQQIFDSKGLLEVN